MSFFTNLFRSRIVVFIVDLVLIIPVVFAAIISWVYQRMGVARLKISAKVFDRVGVVPILDHYYQPLVIPARHLKKELGLERDLPALDINIDGQLALLNQINFRSELLEIPLDGQVGKGFYFHNGSFEAGDSEMLYNFIRYFRPRKIIEIGSGNSTRMTLEAAAVNRSEGYPIDIVCIEPYEQPWLENEAAIRVIRKKVEDVPFHEFESLDENDMLFIDSSHIIRTQGDVLFEFLELLPKLKKGTIIHIHDIYTPRDYPAEVIYDKRFMWNEQYLLEALLSGNDDFKIICALNHLKHSCFKDVSAVCPILEKEPQSEPASFWIKKVR